MKKNIAISFVLTVLLVAPFAVFAITIPAQPQGGVDIKSFISNILDFIWPIFLSLATLMFIIAGFMFLTANGDAGKLGTARNALLWGIIGVVVGVFSFSIPILIQNTIQPPPCGEASAPQCNGKCDNGDICSSIGAAAGACECFPP